MKTNKRKLATKIYQEARIKSIKNIKNCFYPDCNEYSINSHILQRNGILSSISEDSHVMQVEINQFREPNVYIKKSGLKEAFSFNCFCNKHDTELFKSIENNDIDFNSYENKLLFSFRAIYNEIYRKMVNANSYQHLINQHTDKFDFETLRELVFMEKKGLTDLKKIENILWQDLNNKTESYVFKVRETKKKDLCLAAFYNYETSQELEFYLQMNRRHKEDIIDIFVTYFPYKEKSIFIIGYKKINENTITKYINDFLMVDEEVFESKITNLMLFQCETWAISPKLYRDRIIGHDSIFKFCAQFSNKNFNEREFFDLNIFKDDFIKKFNAFKNNTIPTNKV